MKAGEAFSPRRFRWLGFAVAAVVLGLYAWMAHPDTFEFWSRRAKESYYNLLVEGFRSGQLNLRETVPAGFAQLADPYDPQANLGYRMIPYRLHDLSYYRGKLYLYFGVTPALLLFWPWALLTGGYLFHWQAALLLCAGGFLVSAWLLESIRRRCFPSIGAGVGGLCVLALGLTTGAPILLQRADVWEVPIACGYFLTMLGLAAIWRALRAEGWSRCGWIALGSLIFGLSVGARPTLLFGSAALLAAAISGGKRLRWMRWLAAGLPMGLVGLGLMAYNQARFGSPFEFGQHYQLAWDRQGSLRHFSLGYLWFDFRVYFLEPLRWLSARPFVGKMASPALPAGHAAIEDPFGVLSCVPFVWLALAAPLALRDRVGEEKKRLGWFLAALLAVFLGGAGVLCLFYGTCSRYEMEFLPELVLLAAVGVLGWERWLQGRPFRRLGRALWIGLLAFSVAFNLAASVRRYAEQRYNVGNMLFSIGRLPGAIEQYREALRVSPAYAEAENNLANVLFLTGRPAEAVPHFEKALALKPDYPEAQCNLATVLMQLGRKTEAIRHYRAALSLDPSLAPVRAELRRLDASP